MLNTLEPPEAKGKQPVISPALEQALSMIQKGAKERLEVLRSKKSQLEAGEPLDVNVPKVIRHIKKVEPTQADDETVGHTGQDTAAGGGETAEKEIREQVSGRQTAYREMGKEQTGHGQTASEDKPKKKHSTPSVSKIRERKREAVRKEQEQRWKEAAEKRDAASEVDLEEAMMTPEEEDKQEKQKEDEPEGYRKMYTKTHEKRAERSIS